MDRPAPPERREPLERPSSVAKNRAQWEADAPNWVASGRQHWAETEPTWGRWHIPESELRLLDGAPGADAVELGCGTAYVSAWLARAGARPVGVDVTRAQLRTAQQLQEEFSVAFPLVQAAGEQVPLRGSSFDLAISEYGAAIWARSIPLDSRSRPSAAARRRARLPRRHPAAQAVCPRRRERAGRPHARASSVRHALLRMARQR